MEGEQKFNKDIFEGLKEMAIASPISTPGDNDSEWVLHFEFERDEDCIVIKPIVSFYEKDEGEKPTKVHTKEVGKFSDRVEAEHFIKVNKQEFIIETDSTETI